MSDDPQQESADGAEAPVTGQPIRPEDLAPGTPWRVFIDTNLERGSVAASDLIAVYHTAKAERPPADDLSKLLKQMLGVFEKTKGSIADLYVTSQGSAVIRLLHPSPSGLFRHSTVMVVFDADTAHPPEVAEIYTQLEDLIVKSDRVLRGTDQIVFAEEAAYAFQLLVGNTERAGGAGVGAEAVKVLRGELARLQALWERSADRGIPITTLEGMGLGVAAVAAAASLVGWALTYAGIADFRVSTFLGAAISGCLGAVISVLSRMSRGTFHVPRETVRSNVRFLGAIRPFIGATFATIVVFGLIGQVFGVQAVGSISDNVDPFYAYCVFAFIAGFSERWAQNLLSGVAGTLDTSNDSASGADITETDPSTSTGGNANKANPKRRTGTATRN